MKTKAVICMLFVLLAAPLALCAQTEPAGTGTDQLPQYVYQWTDDQGVVHMSDDMSAVPKKFRAKVQRKKLEPPEQQENGEGQARPAPEAPAVSDAEFQQGLRTDALKLRYLDWQERLDKAQTQYRQLEQRRGDIIGKWGSVAIAPIALRLEVEQIDKDMKETQAEIDEAKNMLENVLPEEARKAGIPS